MQRPDLVIFDCDGVLVDTEPVSNAVFAENLTRHGLPLTTEECIGKFTGWSMVNVEEEAVRLGAMLPENWITAVHAEEFAALRQGVAAVNGIPEILDRLAATGIPFCVASNGSEDKMAITLGQTGLLPRFEGAMFSAHTLKTSKPDPALFQAALAAFKVEPARAGIPCLGYAPHGDGADLAKAGAKIFNDMRELPEFLGIKS